MSMLISFAPFIAFAILSRMVAMTTALSVAAALAVLLMLYERLHHGHAFKILDIGVALLFGGLCGLLLISPAQWGAAEVGMWVDSGLVAIVAISMLVRQPFTLQYAREQVPAEVAAHPQFRQVNYVITSVWGLGFLVMAGSDFILSRIPAMPTAIGVTANVTAMVGAVWFTRWYPRYLRRRAIAA